MKILALYHMKGGVGKTAAAVNLAYLAANEGAATLLCDLDPQGSASYYFRIRTPKKFNRKRFLEGGKQIRKSIRGTDFDNLDLLPSDLSFRNLDIALDGEKKPKMRLASLLAPLADEYEYIFLDCPPNLTLVSENVFIAANTIIVPCIPTTLSMITHQKLISFFKKSMLDPSKILTFFSMVESRKRMHRETIRSERAPGACYLESQIPYASDVEKMGVRRKPVACYQPGSRAARSYEDLWAEMKRLL